jgi:hypothetical protein
LAGFAQFVEAQQSLTPAREERNKYDMIWLPVSHLPIINIGQGSLLLVVSVTSSAPLEMLLAFYFCSE